MSTLAAKVEKVRLLLTTLHDPYPAPRASLRPDPGPSRSRYVPCETCRHTGWTKKRDGYALCLSCNGSSWRRRERGDQEWDAYLELPLPEAASLPREPGRPRPEPDDDTFAWERQRAAYDRHGSYRELRTALAWLAHHDERRYRLVRAVLINHEPRTLSALDRIDVDLGVIAIALRMKTVRVPAWLIERSKAAEKRETIEALAGEGLRAGEIAKRLGIPKEVVRRRMRTLRSKRAGIPLGAM
ncbi:MAG TPA: hypothetical protein VLI07_18735 [Candidatus Binatus sp.]|nr:hypothetical protein [Candidatus Binatus sp.]